MHWKVLSKIGKKKACLEFGFEAGSFEQFNCTKPMILRLKYLPLLFSKMRVANDDDRVIFKVADDGTTNPKLLLIELETTTGETTSKIHVEVENLEGDGLQMLKMKCYPCLFVMPSKNLSKFVELGKKFWNMVGFVCKVDEILSTNNGVDMENVDTTLIEFDPWYLKYLPLKIQPFHTRYFEMLRKAESLSQDLTLSLTHEDCVAEFKMTSEEISGYVRFHFDSN